MENKAAKTRSLEIAFVVDADLLRRLATILGEVGDLLDYTLKFSDGSSVQYSDIEEIINQPNSARRAISFLLAEATREGQSGYVTLRNGPKPSVEYTVNGPQRNVIYFGDQLDDWTAAIQQWYSRFLSSSAGPLLALGSFCFPLLLWNGLAVFIPILGGKTRPSSWVQLVFIVALWIGEYWFFKLFPTGTFAIGQGTKRHQFLTYIRNTLLVGFVLSFLASVFANWIMRHP